MVRSVAFVVVVLALVSSAASAQNKFRPKGSPEERACHGDTHRYCEDVFPKEKGVEPDQFKMLACLQAHRAKLSKACAALLQANGV